MLIASLVVLGLVSFNRLGVDLFPEVEFPYVSVTTALPGASPGTMETEVTDVIEEQLNTIAGLRQMRSISAEGVSIVNLEFELEEDADLKAQEVRDKMSRLAADLPDDSEPPVIEKVDPDAAPILTAEDVKVHFTLRGQGGVFAKKHTLRAVDGVSFDIREGEIRAIIGPPF